MKHCGIALLTVLCAVRAQEPQVSAQDRELVLRYMTDDTLPASLLVQRGESLVPVLTRALDEARRSRPDARRVRRALTALDAFGAAAAQPAVLTQLEQMLAEDADTAITLEVLRTMGTLLPWVPRARAGELGELCDRRFRATFPKASGEDVQRLSDIGQRLAMRRLFPADAPIEHLRRCIASETNGWAVEVAVEVARHRGPDAAATLDALVRRLAPPNPNIRGPGPVIDVREKAALAVIAVAPEPAAAVPGHAWLAENGEPQAAVDALAALRALGAKASGAVPVLMRIAKDGTRPTLRRDAIATLGAIGPEARAAAELLAELRDGDDRALSALAARALEQLDG